MDSSRSATSILQAMLKDPSQISAGEYIRYKRLVWRWPPEIQRLFDNEIERLRERRRNLTF